MRRRCAVRLGWSQAISCRAELGECCLRETPNLDAQALRPSSSERGRGEWNMRFTCPDGGGLNTAIVVPRVWHLELAKDRSEMSVDSALRKHQLGRYSGVAQA